MKESKSFVFEKSEEKKNTSKQNSNLKLYKKAKSIGGSDINAGM